MRTGLDTATRDLYLSGEFELHTRVRVENGSDTKIDLSGRYSGYTLKLPDPNEPIGSLTIDFVRETTKGALTDSLAPTVVASSYNKLNDGMTYSPLLQIGRIVTMDVALTAKGGARPEDASTLWYEVFQGYITGVDWPQVEGRKATVTCNGLAGILQIAKSEAPYTYTAGTSIEDVARQILDNNGFEDVLLYFPAATGKVLPNDYAPGLQKTVWSQLWALAQSMGWICYYRYRNRTFPELTFFEPAREKTIPDMTIDPYDWRQLSIDEEEIRNVGYLVYYDPSGVQQMIGPFEDLESIDKYGGSKGIRRPFWIKLELDSPVRGLPEASGMLNAALSDVADPDAVASALTFPLVFAESGVDLYTFLAFDKLFDSNQTFAPFSISIDERVDAEPVSVVNVRGVPTAGTRTWKHLTVTEPAPPSQTARPTAAITTTARTDANQTLSFSGSLHAEGVGPLEWTWRTVIVGLSINPNWEPWTDTDLPDPIVVNRFPKRDIRVEFKVRDAYTGVESEVAFEVVDHSLSAIREDNGGIADNAQFPGGKTASQVTEEARQGAYRRGVNLVTNGNAEEGTNYGFSSLGVVEVDDAPSGQYVFEKTSDTTTDVGDEFIPVDPSGTYLLSAKMRYTSALAPRAYLGLVPFDANKVQISPGDVNAASPTLMTLTANANSGTVIVEVDDALPLVAGPVNYLAFNAVADGSDLPNRTRYQILSVDEANNRYTLTSPLVETFPAGTKVRLHISGATFMYTAASNVLLTPDWMQYSGRVSGVRTPGSTGVGGAQFWNGTRYVKILLLLNREAGGPATTQIDQIEFTPLSFVSQNTDVIDGKEGRRRVDTYYKSDGKILPVVTWERSGVDELPISFFKRGSDTLSDVANDANFRKTAASYVDTSGRVERLRRNSIDEPAANLFKRGSDTLSDVADDATWQRVSASYVDTSGRIDRIRRASTDELPDNLFKRGSNTLGDVLDDSTWQKVAAAYVDTSGRIDRLRRGGLDEIPDNLAKHGVTTLGQLAGSELPGGTTLNGRTPSQLATDSAIDDAANMVFNGSFEAAYTNTQVGLADGWSSTGSVGGGSAFSAGTPRHGSRAQTVTPANASSGTFIASRPFAVRPGNRYRFSVEVFNPSGTEADGFYLRATWWDASQTFISQTDLVSGGTAALALNAWSEQDGIAQAPDNARFCRVYLGTWTQRAGAALTFDRCHVTDESAYLGGLLTDGGGELKPTVRQAGKVLAKGLIEWSGRHGDSIVFPADFFSSIPAVLTRPSGSTYAPAGAGWTPSFDATKRQYQRVIFQDLDAEGFTLVAQMYQKTAVITQRTRDRGSWLLDALNETINSLGLELFSGSPTPPAYDNTYYAQYEIEIGGFHDPLKPWVEYRTEVDVTFETSSDGGTAWTPRHTRTHIWTNLEFGGAGSEVISGQLQATVSGMGTGDQIRLRISRLVTHDGAVHIVRPRSGSTYDFWYYTVTGTENVTSMTPDADDFIFGSALDVTA